MDSASDPFAHHPELRPEIIDIHHSFFRNFTTANLAALMRDHGLPGDWQYSDAEREALRAQALDGHAGDLWIFAYGSLMWDPAFRFAEVRRAHAPGHQRRFILKDVHGARGNEDVPGLMAALDTGAGCNGLAFRIAAEEVEAETDILWRREQVLPAYNAEFIYVDLSDARISALTFVADLDADVIDGNLTRDEQIRYFATGNGFLGTSLDYLANIERHFEKLGIIDDDVAALLHDTRAYVAAGGQPLRGIDVITVVLGGGMWGGEQ